MHKEIYLPLLWDRTLAGGSPAYFQAVTDCGGVDGGKTTGCQGDQQSCNAHVDPSPPIGDWHSALQAYCTGAQAPLDTHSAL